MITIIPGIVKANRIDCAGTMRHGIQIGSCTAPVYPKEGAAYWGYTLSTIGEPLFPIYLQDYDNKILWKEIADAQYGGIDHKNQNLDTADAKLIMSHGYATFVPLNCQATQSCNIMTWSIYLSSEEGSPSGCYTRLNKMMVGDDRTKYLDVFACFSLDISNMENIGNHTDKLHQWHGFYGISNTMVMKDLDDYIDDAWDGGASLAWLENITRWDAWEPGHLDICATSLVFGDDWNEACWNADNESYNPNLGWSFSHEFDVGVYTFFCSCTPNHPNGAIGCD